MPVVDRWGFVGRQVPTPGSLRGHSQVRAGDGYLLPFAGILEGWPRGGMKGGGADVGGALLKSMAVQELNDRSAHAARLALERFCREIAEEGGRVLLILDEAQHARLDLLEELRAIHDMKACACGLVIAGNDSLFDALRGRIDRKSTRLDSRH